MVTLSPDTITYKSVTVTSSNGESSESSSTVSGIKCSVQENRASYIINESGSQIVYTYLIVIKDKVQRDKLPDFNIEDSIIYNSKRFKILSRQDLQMHTEIYV